jgi:hypothetical protein
MKSTARDDAKRTLPQDAPIRRVAMLHAALVASGLGDPAAAQTNLAASGLNADQC